MSTVLTGAFLEISVVEDYEESEEEEHIIGQTTEDVEIERDPEEIEWNEHGNPRTQRREGFESADLNVSMIVTDDRDNLETAEVLDEDGQVRRNVQHEAVYIHLYERPTDDEPATTYVCEDTQFVLENVNFPMDDPGIAEVIGWINGNHGFEINEEAA